MEKLSSELGIQDKVEFLGQLPHDKVMEYMAICDIFSLPSWRESLGLVYLEAMLHGKPIIGCQGQGVDGLIKDRETGLITKPKDVESIIEVMDFLLSNPDKAIMIGEEAKTMNFSKALLKEGVFVSGIVFPTVPKGTGRLRCMISAAHTKEDLDFAIEVFGKVGKDLEII